MKQNVGSTDKLVRYVIGVVAIVLAIMPFVNESWGFLGGATVTAIVFGIIAVIAIGTALTGFCALYSLFGISTCKIPEESS